MKLILVQCQRDATKDSNGDAVGASRRVVAELRTGGRLTFFATGGRLVERERTDGAPLLLDERDVVDRDDDDVACERVPRCEPSDPLMAIQPLRPSCDRIHQVVIQYVQQHQNRLCLLLQQLLPQPLPEYLPREWENSERAP